jgi:hypothetical protein
MSAATTILPAILDTVLGRLTLLFLSGANGDTPAARHAAAQMLASYDPQTANEVRLAASIISFSLHALEALSQAATPDMPLNKILRLRGGAVSLSRESDKAERRLAQLQTTRREGFHPQPAEDETAETNPPEQQHPLADKAIALIEATRQQIKPADKNNAPIWSKAYQQQQAARRITDNLKKNQAAHLAATNAKAEPTTPPL